MSTIAPTHTLVSKLWPTGRLSHAHGLLLCLVGSGIIALSAQVSVPMYPVPMTLQTLAVLLIGSAYGARLGAATVLAYLLEGAVGLPVFSSGHAGLAYMMGPTGGYLVGFVLAAAIVGYLAERGWNSNIAKSFAAMLIGSVVLYIPGLLWLALIIAPAKGLGLVEALRTAAVVGLVPFFPGDLVKAAIAALGLPFANMIVTKK